MLKGATIKGKNMLHIGSIFFPLKVVPMRIENSFKEHKIEKPPKLNCIRQYISLFIRQILMPPILSVLQYIMGCPTINLT